jgi:hypothetical protein
MAGIYQMNAQVKVSCGPGTPSPAGWLAEVLGVCLQYVAAPARASIFTRNGLHIIVQLAPAIAFGEDFPHLSRISTQNSVCRNAVEMCRLTVRFRHSRMPVPIRHDFTNEPTPARERSGVGVFERYRKLRCASEKGSWCLCLVR